MEHQISLLSGLRCYNWRHWPSLVKCLSASVSAQSSDSRAGNGENGIRLFLIASQIFRRPSRSRPNGRPISEGFQHTTMTFSFIVEWLVNFGSSLYEIHQRMQCFDVFQQKTTNGMICYCGERDQYIANCQTNFENVFPDFAWSRLSADSFSACASVCQRSILYSFPELEMEQVRWRSHTAVSVLVFVIDIWYTNAMFTLPLCPMLLTSIKRNAIKLSGGQQITDCSHNCSEAGVVRWECYKWTTFVWQ